MKKKNAFISSGFCPHLPGTPLWALGEFDSGSIDKEGLSTTIESISI